MSLPFACPSVRKHFNSVQSRVLLTDFLQTWNLRNISLGIVSWQILISSDRVIGLDDFSLMVFGL